jgi:hypothetical protein
MSPRPNNRRPHRFGFVPRTLKAAIVSCRTRVPSSPICNKLSLFKHLRLKQQVCHAAGAAVVILFALPIAVAAKESPVAPCGSLVYPAYLSATPPPNVEVWSPGDIPSDWEYPACAGWVSRPFTTLVAVAGAFRLEGGVDDLLVRMGAITDLRGLIYWSVTDHRLEPLIIDAYAVNQKVTDPARPNYTPREMQIGKDLFLVERDNRSRARVLYRMRVLQMAPDKLIIDVDNVSSIRFLFLTLFAPGDLHSTFFFNRLESDEWGYFSLSRANEGKFAALIDQKPSYVNRLIALYALTVQTANVAGMPWAK